MIAIKKRIIEKLKKSQWSSIMTGFNKDGTHAMPSFNHAKKVAVKARALNERSTMKEDSKSTSFFVESSVNCATSKEAAISTMNGGSDTQAIRRWRLRRVINRELMGARMEIVIAQAINHAQAARFENGSQRGRGDAFAQ